MNDNHLLYLGALLLCVGLVIVITRRNAIVVLMGIELMLNASNINLVAFDRYFPGQLDGQMLSLFVIIVAVCEAAVGIAIVLRVYHYYDTARPGDLNQLKEHADRNS
ncbi:MAG: NADH-quinone oxidoreductase subunit NuoK [Cyclobacteriaceae bacterium]|nr:NADH-quinone oxidoreductase subunit NuoK [Cyclobacteriaceae bacterium]